MSESPVIRRVTKAAGEALKPLPPKPLDPTADLKAFFRTCKAFCTPETFAAICVRSGFDPDKHANLCKASEHAPCWDCRFFSDGAHCTKWDATVPLVAQIDGCAEHMAAKVVLPGGTLADIYCPPMADIPF